MLIVAQFDRELYSASAVKKACYRFSGNFSIDIQATAEAFVCSLTPVSDDQSIEGIEAELRREVLDQDLREKIAEKTEGARNAILALAFSQVVGMETPADE